MTITRRQFLKAAGAMGGLALLHPVWETASSFTQASAQSTAGEVTWIPSICNFCSSFCDIKVAVKEVGGVKQAVKIEGNSNSPLNRGKICARGQAGLRQLYDPDRLKQPLIRVEGSKRGEWNFRAATWDEAYDYIAAKLKKVKPWEISMVGGWTACVSYMHFSLPFVGAMQIPNIIASPLQHCVTAGHLGTDLVTGNFNVHDEILADFENARYILFSMNNASVAAISTARAVRFGQAKKKGAKVVCLDPRLSELAAKADEWLPVKPGTDMAFFLAMLHTLLRESLYEKDFLAQHTNAPFLAYRDEAGIVQLAADTDEAGQPTAFYVYDEVSGKIAAVPPFTNTNEYTLHGQRVIPALRSPGNLTWNSKTVQTVFDFFFDQTKDYTPQWAAAITKIPAETIRRIALEFGQARPALVDPGWMGARYQHLIPMRRLQAIIQTLVGGIDQPGGWLMGGEYRHKAEALWQRAQRGDPPPKNVAELPGMHFANALIGLFANPKAWEHGKPALSFAWAAEEQAQGRLGAMLPAMADAGLLEAVRGEFKYQDEAYQMKAFILNAANPVRHYFPAKRWEEALSHDNVELVMAIDVLPSDTTLYADVILPNHTYLERYEPLLYPLGPNPDLAFTTRLRAVDPLYDTRDAVDIFFAIAERMGFFDEYVAGVAEYAGLDLQVLQSQIKAARDAGSPLNEAFLKTAFEAMGHLSEHVTGRKTSGEEVEAVIRDKGVLVLKTAEELLAETSMPRHIPVPSSSGRLELYSPLLVSFANAAGYLPNWDPVAAYMPLVVRDNGASDAPLAKDEFYFTYGKVPVVSHASTNNNNALLAAVTQPKKGAFTGLWMNAAKAAELGLSDGDEVEIENLRYGPKTRAHLFVTEMIRPDTVFLPSAYGSRNPRLSVAGGKGTPLNELMPYSIEPIAASFMSQEFTVRIRSI